MQMRRAPETMLSAVILAFVCACEAPLKYTEPAAETYTTGARQLKIGDEVTSVQAATVTPGFFPATRIQPLLGRFLIDADEGASTPAVAVLSHDLWAERFGSSPSIIGRQIELDQRNFTVVGVAPRGFQFPGATLLWTSKSDAP
jgi:hypothetical protein